MPAFAAYLVGWLIAWLTVREYPSETGARRWMRETQEKPPEREEWSACVSAVAGLLHKAVGAVRASH